MTIGLEHLLILTLVISLYLSWRVYELEKELDKLGHFSVKSITELAKAIDEIEDYLDDQEN